LRAIQDLAVERVGGHGSRHVDVRILVATNRRLATLVEEGVFRADLYHRLSGLEILVPPLRARAADIRPLALQFLAQIRPGGEPRLAVGALDALTAYDWPGNVRELRRVIERAVTLAEGPEIGLAELPRRISDPYREILSPALERGDTLRAWARRYARLVLERHDHNKRQTCRALGISYHTLQTYLDSWVGERRPRPRRIPPPRAATVAEKPAASWSGVERSPPPSAPAARRRPR
jgi:two-component system response regulator AtoC